jgi:HD-like signal output (HDOD) protein
MDNKKVLSNRITQLVDSLPLFPTDIDRLLSAAVKPSGDGVELMRLIESDPEAREGLLGMARFYFGTGEEFQTIAEAAKSIGVQPLVQLIGISYARHIIQEEFTALKYLNEYVDHSEDISIGCRILSEIYDMPRDECEVYALAGLIHDVGRLAILVATDRTGAHVLGTLWDKMSTIVKDEKVEMGTNHCEVGAQICRKWKLSPIIQDGVARHHTPLLHSDDLNFTGGLIFLSHFLSASDPSGDIVSTTLPHELFEKMNLRTSDFDRAKEIYESRTQQHS